MTQPLTIFKYRPSNGGGIEHFFEYHFRQLVNHGWKLYNFCDDFKSDDPCVPVDIDDPSTHDSPERIAEMAVKRFASYEDAVREWEEVTGLSLSDMFCMCCGPDHDIDDVEEEEAHYYPGI